MALAVVLAEEHIPEAALLAVHIDFAVEDSIPEEPVDTDYILAVAVGMDYILLAAVETEPVVLVVVQRQQAEHMLLAEVDMHIPAEVDMHIPAEVSVGTDYIPLEAVALPEPDLVAVDLQADSEILLAVVVLDFVLRLENFDHYFALLVELELTYVCFYKKIFILFYRNFREKTRFFMKGGYSYFTSE